MKKKTVYLILMIVSLVLTLAGLATLLPAAGASHKCMLGYKALCTFSPVSTILMFFIVAVNCRIRKKHFKY